MIICTDLLHTASSGLNDDSLIDEVLTDKKDLALTLSKKEHYRSDQTHACFSNVRWRRKG